MTEVTEDINDKVIYEGFMKKQKWQDYWFRLYNETLHYYISSDSYTSKGFTAIRDMTDIRTTSVKDYDFCIFISTVTGSSFYLATKSSAAQRVWFQHLWKTRNKVIAEIGRETLKNEDSEKMKVFSDEDIYRICSFILSPSNASQLRDYLKLLKNCTEYLKIEEIEKFRENKENNKTLWTHGMERISDQILHNISKDYIENLKQALENKTKQTSKEREEEEKKNLVVAQIINIEKIYKFGRRLGSGTFSTVHIGQDKRTGEKFAIKCIRKCKLSKDDLNGLFMEVDVMVRLKSHPNIVNFIGFYQDVKYYYLVQELCLGGELFSRIVERTFYSELEARGISRTLIATIGYCHMKGIVHRDLKPENILLSTRDDDYSLKVADFGFARQVAYSNHNLLKTSCGSPGYVAPEILLKQPYGPSVDMWSLGVIIYILLCGYPPFHSDNQSVLFSLIKKGEYIFDSPYWDHVSTTAKDLISHLLVVDPEKRFTAKQALEHPWLQFDEDSNNNLRKITKTPQCNLESAIHMLEQFNARRKFKSGVRAVISGIRMRKMTAELSKMKPSIMSDQNKDRPNVYFSTIEKKDKDFKHLLRSQPEFLSPVIGELPPGISLLIEDDVINIYGWWLKVSSTCLIKYNIITNNDVYVMAQPPGYSVYFERQIALKYRSLLSIDDLHIVREDPSNNSPELGKIEGESEVLGIMITTNIDGEWLQVYGTQFNESREGWTLISDNKTKYLEKVE